MRHAALLKCSYDLDVSLGEASNGRQKHTFAHLGEAVLGSLRHCNQSVSVQQIETRSAAGQGKTSPRSTSLTACSAV